MDLRVTAKTPCIAQYCMQGDIVRNHLGRGRLVPLSYQTHHRNLHSIMLVWALLAQMELDGVKTSAPANPVRQSQVLCLQRSLRSSLGSGCLHGADPKDLL